MKTDVMNFLFLQPTSLINAHGKMSIGPYRGRFDENLQLNARNSLSKIQYLYTRTPSGEVLARPRRPFVQRVSSGKITVRTGPKRASASLRHR